MTMTADYIPALFLKILISKSSTTEFFEFFIHSTTCHTYKVFNVPAVVCHTMYLRVHACILTISWSSSNCRYLLLTNHWQSPTVTCIT